MTARPPHADRPALRGYLSLSTYDGALQRRNGRRRNKRLLGILLGALAGGGAVTALAHLGALP